MSRILELVFVVTLFSCPFSYAQTADTLRPEFKFLNTECVIDLGAVTINTQDSYQLEFKNSGGKELIIYNMYITGNGIGPDTKVIIQWPKRPVKPGRKGTITISFTSMNAVGSFQHDVYVSSNVSVENYRLLQIKGAIIPEARKTEDKLGADGFFRLLTPVMQANTR